MLGMLVFAKDSLQGLGISAMAFLPVHLSLSSPFIFPPSFSPSLPPSLHLFPSFLLSFLFIEHVLCASHTVLPEHWRAC